MKLTPRQARFVEEYLKDLNATAAYIRAGYRARGNSAEANAARLIRNDKVAAAIEVAMKERSTRNNIDADRVLKELARIGFVDVRKLFNSDGSLKRLDKLDDDVAASIASIEVNEMRDGDGFVIGHTKKLRLWDKIASLTKLAQHLGLLDTKVTLKGDAQSPLQLLIQQIQGNSLKPVREGVYGEDEREDV